ncbi:MAG: hypothetical protein ACP5NX_02120 [Candidatus Bilamarchaeaceae archaeon]
MAFKPRPPEQGMPYGFVKMTKHEPHLEPLPDHIFKEMLRELNKAEKKGLTFPGGDYYAEQDKKKPGPDKKK